MRLNRSWLPGIMAIVALVVLQRQLFRLPWPALTALAIAAGLWFLWIAWNIWRNPTGGAQLGGGGARVQYWRGQRIELAPAPRQRRPNTPPARQLALALAYGLGGAAMLAIVLLGLLGRFG